MSIVKNNLSDEGMLCFLKRNPSLSSALFADCSHDIQEVTTIIEPVLKAPERCQAASCYIQAVSLGATGFLATNLHTQEKKKDNIAATETASSWLIGRGSTCILNMPDSSVSRCHAVISHHAYIGFFLTDVGSTNGTWVNGEKLKPRHRHTLQDGDLLRFGSLKIELFISDRQQRTQRPGNAISCLTTTPG
ncbi:MAG: FHA domain-containing protein [Cyanobacteria bacterium P01_F01_bin.150]